MKVYKVYDTHFKKYRKGNKVYSTKGAAKLGMHSLIPRQKRAYPDSYKDLEIHEFECIPTNRNISGTQVQRDSYGEH